MAAPRVVVRRSSGLVVAVLAIAHWLEKAMRAQIDKEDFEVVHLHVQLRPLLLAKVDALRARLRLLP